MLILAAVLFVTVKLSKIQKDTSFNKEDIEVNEGLSSESQEIMAGYTTIALFGLDNRSNGNLSKGNRDVIMIASINNDTHAVKLVSVYRDSYLDIGGGTFKKCNSAYAKGGPEQAITMLNKNLDMDITDYVTVDFNAVVECVDLLGGVTIPEVSDEEAVQMHGYMDEINKLTKNNSKYLSGGGTNVEMDGVQACAYARIRYTTGDDYKRTERQRTVLTAMVQKAQKANLTTINSLIDELFGDIKTSFSNTELISLAAKVFKITWYNNASLISKCCRILLKRETYCLTKAVIEYFCGKRRIRLSVMQDSFRMKTAALWNAIQDLLIIRMKAGKREKRI